jgi:flavin-dependent dehydrogenase
MDANLVAQLHTLPSARALADGFVGGPGGAKCWVQFVKPGLMVRRAELDAALFEHARAATPCTVVVSAVKEIHKQANGFLLTLANGQTYSTRRLAAADGANGPCRQALTGHAWQPEEVSVAVRAYLPAPTLVGVGGHALALWFDKAVLPGYFWAFPLADGSLNVGVGILGQQDKSTSIPLKKELTTWLQTQASDGRPFGTPDAATWLGQKLPLGRTGRLASGPGFCLLGDAAGLVAPATGDGIGQAALSGKLAAEALAASLKMPLAATDSFLKNKYDKPLYARLGSSFTAQRSMVWLGQRMPWALNSIIQLASKSVWVRRQLTSL